MRAVRRNRVSAGHAIMLSAVIGLGTSVGLAFVDAAAREDAVSRAAHNDPCEALPSAARPRRRPRAALSAGRGQCGRCAGRLQRRRRDRPGDRRARRGPLLDDIRWPGERNNQRGAGCRRGPHRLWVGERADRARATSSSIRRSGKKTTTGSAPHWPRGIQWRSVFRSRRRCAGRARFRRAGGGRRADLLRHAHGPQSDAGSQTFRRQSVPDSGIGAGPHRGLFRENMSLVWGDFDGNLVGRSGDRRSGAIPIL